jgi:hypothetical protein
MNKRINADIPSVCEIVFGKKVERIAARVRNSEDAATYHMNTLFLPTEELVNMEWAIDTSRMAEDWANSPTIKKYWD